MALGTLGTAATTTLHSIIAGEGGLLFSGVGKQGQLNVALFNGAIKDDQTGNLLRTNPLFGFDGQLTGTTTGGCTLTIPNRGILRVFAGDIIGYDTTTGWPILVSATAAAGAGWVHSP